MDLVAGTRQLDGSKSVVGKRLLQGFQRLLVIRQLQRGDAVLTLHVTRDGERQLNGDTPFALDDSQIETRAGVT